MVCLAVAVFAPAVRSARDVVVVVVAVVKPGQPYSGWDSEAGKVRWFQEGRAGQVGSFARGHRRFLGSCGYAGTDPAAFLE